MNTANNYPWTRYWVPRDKGYTPDGAYLADPESEYVWADANRAVSLATLCNKPVLVLLGEAGMDADLTQVVLESLARLQQSLRGETLLAPFLWDEDSRKPKSEGRLSDFVKHHLSSDLNRRGVLINREVEIKNLSGKGRGESLDLLIQAVTSKNGPAATVVEVKGCWILTWIQQWKLSFGTSI